MKTYFQEKIELDVFNEFWRSHNREEYDNSFKGFENIYFKNVEIPFISKEEEN